MIDSFIRSIEMKSDFIPPKPSPILSSHSLAFMLLNVLTAGIYGSIEILSKQHRITVLSINQELLEQNLQGLNQSWECLENDLRELSSHVKAMVDAEITDFQDVQSKLDKVEHLNKHYRQPLTYLNGQLNSSVARIALDCLAFFGQLFLNVVTLGGYGIYQNCALKNQIGFIEAENNCMILKINRAKKNKADAIEAQVIALRQLLATHHNLKEIRQINLEETHALISQLNERVEALQQETENLRNQVTAEKVIDQQLNIAISDLRKALNSQAREMFRLVDVQERLTKVEKDQLSKRRQLQGKIAAYQRDREFAKAASERVALLQKEVSQLEFIHWNKEAIQKSQEEVGPIPPKYRRRIRQEQEEGDERAYDGEIRGAYGIELGENDDDLMSDYAKRYNDKKTAVELVRAGFKFAFDDLLAKAQEPSAYITFNRSSKLYQNGMYRTKKNAIFRRIIWDFIEHAKLEQIDCHSWGFVLNNQGVTMKASNPVSVYTYRDVGENRKLEQRVLLTAFDEFSPSMEDPELKLGIDPPSAKWIFNRLSTEEKHHLFNLLMEPFIADQAQQMLDLQIFFKNTDNEHVELVKIAHRLICDMALTLEKQFDQKGLLTDLWLEREEIVFFDDAQNSNWTPWMPNMEVLWKGSNRENREIFLQYFFGAHQEYQDVFQAITKDLLIGQLDNEIEMRNHPVKWSSRVVYRNGELDIQRGLSHQYNRLDGAKDSTDVFSTLLTLLMNHQESLTKSMVAELRQILADSLDDPEIAKKFAERISQTYYQPHLRRGMSVEEYQQALRGDTLIPKGGEIEIELTALVFGVRIGVFVPNEKITLDENGLMVPADPKWYFGPFTRETLMLYKESETTYYGVFPGLNSPESGHKAFEAITNLNKYWSDGL